MINTPMTFSYLYQHPVQCLQCTGDCKQPVVFQEITDIILQNLFVLNYMTRSCIEPVPPFLLTHWEVGAYNGFLSALSLMLRKTNADLRSWNAWFNLLLMLVAYFQFILLLCSSHVLIPIPNIDLFKVKQGLAPMI